MKKLFLFLPALLLSLLANAAVINITPTSPYDTHDNLRLALYYAQSGDIIEMAAGTYEESNSNYIAFNAKNVIVKAADDANVIIKPHVPFTVSGGARAEIQGVKIDASELCSLGSYSHLMYASDNSDNNRLILDGCEVYGYTVGKAVIACRSSYKLDSLIINNCKFYNHTTRSCVFLENTENKGLIVTNSTFYNIATGTESFGAGIIDDRNSAAKVRVDHCTFYNVVAQNTDYAAVGKIAISDGIVSNSIFAMPTSTDGLRAIRGVAQANNCLTYNYTYDSNWGIHSSVTKNNCIQLQDPLFTDAANGDFSLAGNWITMNLSPARGAATDGSDLGDPRWYTAEMLPSTNFASPGYFFDGPHALLTGNIELNAGNYIKSTNNKTEWGTATWKVHATNGARLQITLNMDPDAEASGHNYTVEIFDAENVSKGALSEGGWYNNVDEKTLSGSISLPSAGDYKIVLSNNQEWSSAVIKGITLMSAGKAFTEIPGTLDPYDANTSAAAYAAADGLHFAENPSSHNIATEWASWKVRAAEDGTFLFTMNVTSTNMQSYKITIYDSEDNVIDYYASNSLSSGDKSIAQYFYLEAGDYTVKVQPTYNWSHGYMKSLVVTEPADLLVIDENAANNDYLTAHLDETANIQITRTLLPGMYNTICLPFPVNSIAQLQNALGCEVELLKMSDAVIEEGGFVLTLTFTTDDSMYQGSPYLIKPAKKVVNPVFKDVAIKATTAGSRHYNETYCIGTLISSEVPAGANNLFLGSENKLYFSDAATPIKGMRAYFRIDESVPAPSRARIVAHEEVVTEVELVNGTLPDTFGNKAVKRIDNGQLLIIRNGAYYNVMGQIVK